MDDTLCGHREEDGIVYSLQRDSDPKEFYFNLYGLHSIPSAPFNWDKIAGKKLHHLSAFA